MTTDTVIQTHNTNIRQLLKELVMRKAKDQVTYSKFLPEDSKFVNVKGNYWEHDNWEVGITFTTNGYRTNNIWVTEYDPEEEKILNELATAISKAQAAITKFKARAKVESAAAKVAKPAKAAVKKKK